MGHLELKTHLHNDRGIFTCQQISDPCLSNNVSCLKNSLIGLSSSDGQDDIHKKTV